MSKSKSKKVVRNRHILYEASVQAVETDLDLIEKLYRRAHKRDFTHLREDFCGTAMLACDWVSRGDDHQAVGIDLHQPTLDWGVKHHLARLGDARDRVTLLNQDVRIPTDPVDVVVAFNFSYWVFHTRKELRSYFQGVRESLRPGGIYMLDTYGGTDAMTVTTEKRRITGETDPDGNALAPFTYIWEQTAFNPVDHRIACYIHFQLSNGDMFRRAFKYDWRVWTLPEMSEILIEAGFERTEFYIDGFDEDDEADGIFRRRTKFENHPSWVGYMAAYA